LFNHSADDARSPQPKPDPERIWAPLMPRTLGVSRPASDDTCTLGFPGFNVARRRPRPAITPGRSHRRVGLTRVTVGPFCAGRSFVAGELSQTDTEIVVIGRLRTISLAGSADDDQLVGVCRADVTKPGAHQAHQSLQETQGDSTPTAATTAPEHHETNHEPQKTNSPNPDGGSDCPQ
jgi:hypothetical protein